MTWSGIKGCGYTRFQRRIIVWWVSGASILHHTLKRIPKYLIKLYIFASYWHPKLAQFRSAGQSEQTSQTGHVNRTNRFGKHCKISNWTAPLRRAHRDNRNAYIERPIWSGGGGQFMPPGRPTLGMTSPGAVRLVQAAQSELEVVFWHGICLVSTPIRYKPPHPIYIYEGPRPIEDIPNRINKLYLYYFQTLAFPILLLFFLHVWRLKAF